jgi:predicted NBD/HSP70 family sugar kinase
LSGLGNGDRAAHEESRVGFLSGANRINDARLARLEDNKQNGLLGACDQLEHFIKIRRPRLVLVLLGPGFRRVRREPDIDVRASILERQRHRAIGVSNPERCGLLPVATTRVGVRLQTLPIGLKRFRHERRKGLFTEFLSKRGRNRVEVRGIGLNVPGPVDVACGRTINPPIMAGWHDFDIRGAFGAAYHCPVVVEKDGTAMAFGEHRRAYPSIPNLVFIKLVTGIGTGIVVDGKPYRGMDSGAGDVGHIAYSGQDEREPPLCPCGNVGCVEADASGWALVRDLATLGLEVTSIDDVVRLVRLGNPDAIRLVRRAAAVFGAAVSDIVSILNPGVVAIGGQLAAIGDLLFAGVREAVYRRSLPLATRNLQVLQTALSERAVVLGLAELVADRVYWAEDVDLMVAE